MHIFFLVLLFIYLIEKFFKYLNIVFILYDLVYFATSITGRLFYLHQYSFQTRIHIIQPQIKKSPQTCRLR